MKIYGIGDLHLSFSENIDKPMNVFGESWANHDVRLRQAWIELVGAEDIVLIPGDISWAMRLEDAIADFDWIHELPGTKIISKGNHDLWWGKITYLNTLYDDIVFLQNDCYEVPGTDIVIVASRGWAYPGSDEYTEHDEKIYARELGRLRLGLEQARKLSSSAEPSSSIIDTSTDNTSCNGAANMKESGDALDRLNRDNQGDQSNSDTHINMNNCNAEVSAGLNSGVIDTSIDITSSRGAAPGYRIIACLHFPPSDAAGRRTGFTDLLEEYGVWKCVYGHLHGQSSFYRGIKGEHRGVDYSLVSMDYLGARPALIYETT